MKKGSILFSFLLVLLLGFSQIDAQSTIDITFPNNTTANPVSVCQCDTMGTSLDLVSGVPKSQPLKYFIGGAPFNPTSDFYYEIIYNYNGTPSAIDDSLELFELTPAAPNQANPVDTFGIGAKWAHLIVPCNAPVGVAAVRIINSSTGLPTSDTAYFNINQMPNKPVIDSIAGGFPSVYAPQGEDWAFCAGDSVTLYAGTQTGSPNITWLLNGAPYINSATGFPYTDDSLVVKEAGVYAVRMDFGFCERDSKDTTILISVPPTLITFSPTSPGRQIDNPRTIMLNPIDSIQFCENETAVLVGPAPATALGLTFKYTWLTDSITSFGDTVFYMIDAGDTLRTQNVDTTGRYYVVINDGFCTDTSKPYFAYEDTIPDPLINYQTWSNGILDPHMQSLEICMTDSVLLSVPDLPLLPNAQTGDTLLAFQWQRLNTSNVPPVWTDVNTTNYDRDGDDWTLQVDTSIKPIRALSFFRLRITTLTPFSKSPICDYYTDSVIIRWKPVDSLLHQMDPWVFSVGKERINFCARDSATLIASATPNIMVNNGYNYSYQWMRDSLDTAINMMVKVPIIGETARTLVVNESGTYYVYIDDGICGDTVRPYRVFVDSIPTTSVVNVPATADRNLCIDESLVVSATDTVNGVGGRWKYQWIADFGGGPVVLTNDTLPWLEIDTAYRPSGVDTLYFTLLTYYTNQFGLEICPDTTQRFSVQFFDPPTINFFPGDSIGVCPGDSVLVIAQGNSFTYLWSTGATSADTWLSGAGTYTVTGTGINQCTNSRDIVIYDLQTTANAGPDVTIFSGETANLSASGGIDYQWGASKPIAWGDILSQNTTVSYTLPDGVTSDTIKVYVNVFNSDGCSDSDTLLLIVTRDLGPGTSLIDQAWNVFTPDGNGTGDLWDISEITNRYGGCRIDIMNRWGSVIYANEDFNGVWDGNNNGGNPVPDGTYYYILSCDGEIILKNAVTVIRNQ